MIKEKELPNGPNVSNLAKDFELNTKLAALAKKQN